MSLKIQFASLSLGAAVDQQTGNLSVFDVVEEIRTPQLPIHVQNMVISLAILKRDANAVNGKMFIHFLTPDGKQALVGSGDMGIPADQKRMKAVFRFGGLPLTLFGQHRFVVSWVNQAGNKECEAILDFEVVQVTQVAQGVAPAPGEKPPLAH